MTHEERIEIARRWASRINPFGDKTDLIKGYVAGHKECEESVIIVDADDNKVTPETLKNACEIVRNTTKEKVIDEACEWLRSKGAFCHAGQYNNNEVSEEEFRKAIKK